MNSAQKMLTAKEAREIADNSLNKGFLISVKESVEKECNKGSHFVRVNLEGINDLTKNRLIDELCERLYQLEVTSNEILIEW